MVDSPEKKLLLSLEELVYVSSAGLRILLLTAKAAKKSKAKVVLAAMNENVREVFDISGFSTLFTIVPTQEEALALLQ